MREKKGEGFILKNYLTSNIKNDIKRTKSDFAIPIQGINMETLSLFHINPQSKPRLYLWIYTVLLTECESAHLLAEGVRKKICKPGWPAGNTVANFNIYKIGAKYTVIHTNTHTVT